MQYRREQRSEYLAAVYMHDMFDASIDVDIRIYS